MLTDPFLSYAFAAALVTNPFLSELLPVMSLSTVLIVARHRLSR